MFNQFLSALMVLITSFSQGGKPAVTPPFSQEEVVARGQQVSNLARDLKNLLKPNQETGNETGNETTDNGEGEVPNPNMPNVTRVPAINLRSGRDMPTFIPQVALDHSEALAPFPTATPIPTPTGSETTDAGGSQPEEGQTNSARNFGLGRGSSVQNNGR